MALFKFKKTAQADQKKVDEEEKKSAVTDKTTTKKAKTEPSMKDLYAEADTKVTKTAIKGLGKINPSLQNLLIKPLVTEKATNLAADNKYVFMVANNANKISVTKAIQSVYGVKPVAVNIISMKGKSVTRGRIKGYRKDWKKAVVSLAKGDTIAIYEGV